MRGFRETLFVRQKLVATGSPIRRHPVTDIPRDKNLSILSIGNHTEGRQSESLSC